MSADPIYDGVKDGFGLYTYCRNNPLIYHDPSGLSTQYNDVFSPAFKKELNQNFISPAIVAMVTKYAYDYANRVGKNQGWDTPKEVPNQPGNFTSEVWQGRIDAFRHAFWSAKLTQIFGKDKAKLITDLYEKYHPNSNPKETDMDLFNNEQGRNITATNPFQTDKQIENTIVNKINNDELKRFTDWENASDAQNLVGGNPPSSSTNTTINNTQQQKKQNP